MAIFVFTDEFTSSHDGNGLEMDTRLSRTCSEVSRALGIWVGG